VSKAFRFHRHGGPEVLRFEEVDPGDPDPVAPRQLGTLGSIYLTHPSVSNYTVTRATCSRRRTICWQWWRAGK
jgi:hypothetical protein